MRLVSRAVAVLLGLPALFSLLTGIPQQVWILSQITGTQSSLMSAQAHLLNRQELGIGINLLRIVAELLIATMFWRCGPAIEQLLSPVDSN